MYEVQGLGRAGHLERVVLVMHVGERTLLESCGKQGDHCLDS
jgi:hypothetical protein